MIQVEEHPYLYRIGDDLYSEIQLSVAQATLGDTINVKTMDGTIELKVCFWSLVSPNLQRYLQVFNTEISE